jgi:hypothetical protein
MSSTGDKWNTRLGPDLPVKWSLNCLICPALTMSAATVDHYPLGVRLPLCQLQERHTHSCWETLLISTFDKQKGTAHKTLLNISRVRKKTQVSSFSAHIHISLHIWKLVFRLRICSAAHRSAALLRNMGTHFKSLVEASLRNLSSF